MVVDGIRPAALDPLADTPPRTGCVPSLA